MIDIVNVSKKFGSQEILKNLNLHIDKGERVVLLGQNGAGKSSLVKVLLGEYRPDFGQVNINGINPLIERKNALKHISFVPQTPPPIRLNLKELCEFVCKSSNVKFEIIDQICRKIGLNLEENLKKSFYKLSGGMKQKFLISVAMSRDSDILIFDEPTANLDVEARELFLQMLSKIGSEKTVILISHRLLEVQDIITREIYMDLGSVTKDSKSGGGA